MSNFWKKAFFGATAAVGVFFLIRAARRSHTRLRELQGLWSDYVRGEWWINEDGTSDFADSDIGEQDHVGIAVDAMLDGDVLREYFVEKGTDEEELEYVTPAGFFFNYNIPDEIGVIAAGSKEAWDDLKYDPRVAYMKHHNAVRAINNQFEAWKVTPKTIRAIQSFLYDQSQGDEAPEGDTEVCVEEIESRRYACKPVSEFLTIKMPGKLWR